MAEAAIPLFGDAVRSDRKSEWLAHLSRCYDSWSKDAGGEPEGFVFVLMDGKNLHAYWDLAGSLNSIPHMALSSASLAIAAHFRREAVPEAEDGAG